MSSGSKGSSFIEFLRKYWPLGVAILGAAGSIVTSLIPGVENVGPYISLSAFALFGLVGIWWLRRLRLPFKILLSVAVLALAAGGSYLVYRQNLQARHPSFEITTLNALPDDPAVYEVTDHLIWNRFELADYGVEITFILEIVPNYEGERRFGSVVALISGDGGHAPIVKPLWTDFGADSGSRQLGLTLDELVEASGIGVNSDSTLHRFQGDEPAYSQARLRIQVAREADKDHPWATQELAVRNTPWELRSVLVEREGERQLDVSLRNLGAPGKFTVRYRLVRLEPEIDSSPDPEVSGTTAIDNWNEPAELWRLEAGQRVTDTVSMPGSLATGRYLIEAYAVKEQPYVRFSDPGASWSNLNSLDSPWWFGGTPSNLHLFVVTEPPFAIDPLARAEGERLREEEDIDLGVALKPAEQVTSSRGTRGVRQLFQEGEVYVYGGKAYALYGPILERYQAHGGSQDVRLGFPISPIRPVVSDSGAGWMAQFEGQGAPHPPSAIYASTEGVGAIWQWIALVYMESEGGHAGWLGLPLADEQYFAQSTIQAFERGYIVYYVPEVDGDQDWTREPVAYPYLSSQGTLVDVHADRGWQDTGISVREGDRVTIVQIDGAWTCWAANVPYHDAAGAAPWASEDEGIVTSAPIGSLVGRLDKGPRTAFAVGRWKEYTATSDGTLELAMNDSYYEDNAGRITVAITIERAQE
jgi:hypothetical protein